MKVVISEVLLKMEELLKLKLIIALSLEEEVSNKL